MGNKKVIAVTSFTNFLGSQLAKTLSSEPNHHVIGIDIREPDKNTQNIDYIQADIRNPLIADLLRAEKVDTLCHLDFIQSISPDDEIFNYNVLGTIRLLEACLQAGVRNVVFKSSTMVYGAHPSNPGFLLETSSLRAKREYGYLRDLVEIETFFEGFRNQHPEINLSILRYANIIGPEISSPMTAFLLKPLSFVLLGFNPLMQFVHQQDVIASLRNACIYNFSGVYNIAAPGLLPLSKVLSLVGKIPLPILHPLVYWSANFSSKTNQNQFALHPDYLRYRWVVNTNKMQQDLNFDPLYTAEEAVREYSGYLRLKDQAPPYIDLDFDEERLRDTIARRKRSKT